MKDGGPAFPLNEPFKGSGMSLRDYFAAVSLPGVMETILAGAKAGLSAGPTLVARAAYEIADAMLAEREKKE